jgi:predicted DNA-binding antitoxin AbrB/MazE fold protein
MITVEAIYQGGVLKPLKEVDLRENQKVRLTIDDPVSFDPEYVRAWLAEVQQFQQKIIAERGYFPDSTPDIAADRNRDE